MFKSSKGSKVQKFKCLKVQMFKSSKRFKCSKGSNVQKSSKVQMISYIHLEPFLEPHLTF
jgi:hypothetical protein